MKLYDNGGETMDRYTIVAEDGGVYGMSSDPNSPQGFNQFVGTEGEMSWKDNSAMGPEIARIPDNIIKAIAQRL